MATPSVPKELFATRCHSGCKQPFPNRCLPLDNYLKAQLERRLRRQHRFFRNFFFAQEKVKYFIRHGLQIIGIRASTKDQA